MISEVTQAQKAEIARFMQVCPIRVLPDESDVVFAITLTLRAGEDMVRLAITDYHTHIVLIERNGEVLLKDGKASDANSGLTNRSVLSVAVICDFADSCDLTDVRELVGKQIAYNYAIAEEGMANPWGANIGKVIRDCYGQDVQHRARYMAAAASDARMSGCEMPVIIVSGSGNQGHHGLRAGDRVREGDGREPREDAARRAAFRPSGDSPEDRHRPSERLLRRGQRGLRGGRGHRLPARWRAARGGAYAGQLAGDRLGHDLRRREGLLRSEDLRGGGRGHHGLQHVPLRSAVPRRRRYRDQGRGEHDREHRAHRPPRACARRTRKSSES